MRGNGRRLTGTLFVFVGSCLLLAFAWQLVAPAFAAEQRQRALRASFTADPTVEEPTPPGPSVAPTPRRAAGTPTPRLTLPPKAKPLGRNGPKPVARIRIPAIGVDQIVVEGVSLARLAYGPGRYPDSAPFGGRGVAAIAGHRTGWGSPFIDVDRLRRGDRIVVETKKTVYTYAVSSLRTVRPTDVWVLKGDPRSSAPRKLVLTTCTPKYTDRDRLIVWADLVSTRAR